MINEIEYSKVMNNNPSAAEKGAHGKWSRVTRQFIACGAILLGLGVSSALAQGQVAVSTVAGSNPSIQPGSADGTGSAALFNNPAGVAVDS